MSEVSIQITGEHAAVTAAIQLLEELLGARIRIRPAADGYQATGQLLVEAPAAAKTLVSPIGPASQSLTTESAGTSLDHWHVRPLPKIGRMVGRQHELAEACMILNRSTVQVLTLLGPSGIGKTHLALHIAEQIADRFPNGMAFVPFEPINNPALLFPFIAQTLGIKEVAGQSLVETLQHELSSKSLLLLLDSIEQITEAAQSLDTFLRSTPSVKVLATSSMPLNIKGEQTLTVPPLAYPASERLPPFERLKEYDAIRLFVERAQVHKPDFTVTSENIQAVAQICRQLAGVPLAIELAAARIGLLSPYTILVWLNSSRSNLPLKTPGDTDIQRPLRDTIAWSYKLLDSDKQRLFRRLGVFMGGCTSTAVLAVCQPQQPILGTSPQINPISPGEDIPALSAEDVLASLVDKRLLRQEQDSENERRFIMHEIIREYAMEQLALSEESEALLRRHAEHYLTLAESAAPELLGPSYRHWLERLEREHDNLRAAIGWALDQGEHEIALRLTAALWRFWHFHSHLSEGRRWIEAAVTLAESQTVQPSTSAALAAALSGAGWIANLQGEFDQAMQFFEESLAWAQKLQNTSAVAMALSGIGRMAHLQGDYQRATELYQQSLARFRALGDTREIGWSLIRLGLIALEQHTYAQAQSLFEESYTCFQAVGFQWGMIWAQLYGGDVLLAQGSIPQAVTIYEHSLAYFQELGDQSSVALGHTRMGRAMHLQHSKALAQEHYREGLLLFQRIGDKSGSAECLEALAALSD